jgi:hypothetical protein
MPMRRRVDVTHGAASFRGSAEACPGKQYRLLANINEARCSSAICLTPTPALISIEGCTKSLYITDSSASDSVKDDRKPNHPMPTTSHHSTIWSYSKRRA